MLQISLFLYVRGHEHFQYVYHDVNFQSFEHQCIYYDVVQSIEHNENCCRLYKTDVYYSIKREREGETRFPETGKTVITGICVLLTLKMWNLNDLQPRFFFLARSPFSSSKIATTSNEWIMEPMLVWLLLLPVVSACIVVGRSIFNGSFWWIKKKFSNKLKMLWLETISMIAFR